jgi:hypothetical protein
LTAAAWKARSAAKGGKGVFGSAMAWEVSRRHDFLSSHESYSAASPSLPAQVEHNRESTARQYALVTKAAELG